MLRERTLQKIRRRMEELLSGSDSHPVCTTHPCPGDIIEMIDEILDWRGSMDVLGDDRCGDEKHCSCVPYLQHRVSVLEDAIRGAVDHSDLDGPDILDEAADMLEEKTITLASQLRKTAKMQREALQEEGQ